MTNAFMVSGLTKTYQDFVLDHVSFTVPMAQEKARQSMRL